MSLSGSMRGVGVLLGVECCLAGTGPISGEVLSHARDYGFMWWAHGLRGRSPEGHRVFCVQTNRYGFAFDLEAATLTHLGAIADPRPESDAMLQPNEAVFSLPAVKWEAGLEIDGQQYTLTSLAPKSEDVHIIEHGRFVQRIEIHDLRFADSQGKSPEKINPLLEIVAWPDRVALLLHLTPGLALRKPRLWMRLLPAGATTATGAATHLGDSARCLSDPSDPAAVAVLRLPGTEWGPDDGEAGIRLRTLESPWWEGEQRWTLPLVVLPCRAGNDGDAIAQRIRQELEPREARTMAATGIAPYAHPLEVAYDTYRGHYEVRLGRTDVDGWTPGRDLDRLERVALHLIGNQERARTVRVVFSRHHKMPGLTGMTPMLRDVEGYPVGVPVQISKNWHGVYWFRGSTMLRLPAEAEYDLEFTMAYARWGGVPAISHAQLCLEGWGGHQLWHEVAIGSFGESITYDPDVGLQRSFIDDVRPLMVQSMTSEQSRDERWGWTNNVGGGDFLVYFNESGQRQYLSRVRTAYTRYGPNLAEVTYAGRTADGRIDAVITVRHGRGDDIVRGLYHIRYDVREPAPIKRLAFFQLGADHYNDHQFRTAARGNADGLTEEWAVKLESPGYHRRGIPCNDRLPWFSLQDGIPRPNNRDRAYDRAQDGAWANRGFVVRSWKARLGGREVPFPHASEFGTTNGPPSVLIELSPPAELTRLETGDFVEADVEMLVLPMHAEDYYGPNETLHRALREHANTWRIVHREAVGNDLSVTASRGTVERVYPIRVRCDESGAVEFAFRGGHGYVPITIAGVHDYHRCSLERRMADGSWQPLDQSVHGRDFWQAEHDPAARRWDITFNVSRDEGPGSLTEQAFRLR